MEENHVDATGEPARQASAGVCPTFAHNICRLSVTYMSLQPSVPTRTLRIDQHEPEYTILSSQRAVIDSQSQVSVDAARL